MIIALVKRNLKGYFRDKGNVFFSMLGVIIIIALYFTFLGNLIEGSANDFAGENARFLIDAWIMGGVIAASTITATLGAYSIMVNDQEQKISRDFKASPLKNSSLILAYLFSAILIGIFMSVFTFILAQLYILLNGSMLSLLTIIKVFGIVILSVSTSSSILFFLMFFIKSASAMSAISIVTGTLVGFLTGVYLPIGNLPLGMQNVVKAFPPSHAAVLLRQVMMNEAIPIDQIPVEFKLFLGVEFEVNGTILSPYIHILVLLFTMILFFGLSLVVVSRKKEKE